MIRDKLERSAIDDAVIQVRDMLAYRIRKKGDGAYAGPHETFGIIHEEYAELSDALRANNEGCFWEALTDIAVACILGMASQLPRDTAQASGEVVEPSEEDSDG